MILILLGTLTNLKMRHNSLSYLCKWWCVWNPNEAYPLL